MISVALPTYNNSNIIWLQLESLCNQVGASDWELIIIEEPSKNYFSQNGINPYKNRLFKAGCVEIKYIKLKEWIPLGLKWLICRDNMNKDSVGMLLCASDNYSPEWRLKNTYEAFKKGADWYQSKSGYFYNILSGESGIFEKNRSKMPALFMAISKNALDKVSDSEYPKKSVDTWLFEKSHSVNLIEEDFANSGVHTDGLNTISHNRRDLYKDGNSIGLFKSVDSEEVFKVFPLEIQKRLLKIKQKHES